MSIASNFRAKMDVALDSADRTNVLPERDARRARLHRDLDDAGLILMEKDMMVALMDAAKK